jgi:hypothetical protein
MTMTIVDTLDDPELFAGAFAPRGTWPAWRTCLRALFALSPAPDDAERYTAHTGRRVWPPAPAREAWLVVGRRGGKSRMAALVAVYLACFRDYRPTLAPGERATIMVIAADRRQARVVLRYIAGFFDGTPLLRPLVQRRTAEALHLTTRVTIEVHTASFRAVRGYTVAAAICDEIAFWRSDESANPDTEILAALRPAMATVPGALLLCLSSPYARRGALWEAYRDHYGHEGDPVLVWQAPSRIMNPQLAEAVVRAAYAADPAAASAEYGAEFRRDIEAFLTREMVDPCVDTGCRDRAPVAAAHYHAFVDPSGGAADAMTLAIAHQENRLVVLDTLAERRPPFSPEAVVEEFAALLARYQVTTVVGDRYGGEWPREAFRRHGITYEVADTPCSDLYRDLLPLITSQQVALLDHPRLVTQLCSLERRTGRGGRDQIDHPPGAHDDLANAAAGALVLAARRRTSGLPLAILDLAPLGRGWTSA